MFDIKDNLSKLPDQPGVYLHKDKLGQVIYVGKAISLKNRVRQYFQRSARQNPKTRALVSNIAEFEWITCNSELEALILECNLIKKYMPKYNVLLRDDKTYPYIVVTTNEEYPRILKTRIMKRDGNKYFGPYSDAGAVNRIVELLNDVYSLKRCSALTFPDGFRPCLNYHMGKCLGTCTGQVDVKRYNESVDAAMEYLKGKDSQIINYLKNKMEAASETLEFEEAAKFRDLIEDAKSLMQSQSVTMINQEYLDIVLPLRGNNKSFIVVFTVSKGKLSGRETFPIQATKEDSSSKLVGEFLKQYYSRWAKVPPEIIVESMLEEKDLIEEFLSSEGRKVRIHLPERGPKKQLLTMVQRDRNAMAETIELKEQSTLEKKTTLRNEISDILISMGYDIKTEDYRIESYDISNTNGVDSVGAMVVFHGLKPVKKDYRRFKIKTVNGTDDYASLQEVIYRRFNRALNGDKGFSNMPDLILMDGGQGQVNAALTVLKAMKLDIPVAGLAKDSSHRTRAIVFSDGREIDLKERGFLFKYCGAIQEEVHRFAIDYHRSLRTKKITSVLDQIEGVGPTRRNALLEHFDSIDAIKMATKEQLLEVESINEKIAENIMSFFGKL